MSIKKYIPQFIISCYHFFLAALGALLYGFPSRKLIVIGITGTCGKTTVADMTLRILEEAGYKTAVLSSIKFRIDGKEQINALKMTMPGRFILQKFLRQAVDAKCRYAVLEVTSEGILQHRHRFIDFDISVFTNLSPEHIERHKGFENYKKAKAKLFQALNSFKKKGVKKTIVVNIDDKNAPYYLSFPADKKCGYSIGKKSVQNLELATAENLGNGRFSLNNEIFNLGLPGVFNIYNALAAICVGLSQGIDLKVCKSALEKIKKIPGRMETVISEPFTVIVDYAHTPDALEKAYKTVQNKRIICVLGSCGGGRDKWKRPELGRIAAKYCDKVIITNEDPYDEDPDDIIDQVAEGCLKAEKILDRRDAIKKALTLAQSSDIVIITGKGCEPWMCVAKGKKIAWDDRKIVREEFDKITKNQKADGAENI